MAQPNLVVGDVDGNTSRIVAAFNEVRDRYQADIVMVPGLAVSGFPAEDFRRRQCTTIAAYFSQLDQAGWVVRFLARGSSRKAAEIASSGRISLSYQYDAEKAYVTLMGAASIIDDRAYLHDQWRPEWNVFFPGGPSGMDSVIIEVTVERIEVWNFVLKIAAPPRCASRNAAAHVVR